MKLIVRTYCSYMTPGVYSKYSVTLGSLRFHVINYHIVVELELPKGPEIAHI